MNHWSVTTIMTIVTIFALFGDDIKLAYFTKEADSTFDNLTFISLILFSVEITLNALSQDGYFNSFYFWLDLISTLSLITDISWIWVLIIGDSDYEASDATQASQLARAGRGARIGTRAGRITRVIRLVRLIRVGRLWRQANDIQNKKADDDEFSKLLVKQRTMRREEQLQSLENSKKELDAIASKEKKSLTTPNKVVDEGRMNSVSNSDLDLGSEQKQQDESADSKLAVHADDTLEQSLKYL